MKRFNLKKAFKKIRAEKQGEREAWANYGRRKWAAWTAYGQRSKALHSLMDLFPSEGAGTLDVGRATQLMIEYAQTLPTEWVTARVEFVSDRLTKLAEEGKAVGDSDLKQILLNLLLLAHAGDQTEVSEIFEESTQGDPNDLESFRLCLVNWLADKVVDTWPPEPEELRPPTDTSEEKLEVETPLDVSSTMPAKEEWMPASKAVERAEQRGHSVSLKWLTNDAHKHGVGIRKPQQPGRHKKEVEWNSLAGYLLKHEQPENESEEVAISSRIREENEKKRKDLPLN